jgi:hypothetical protein
MLRSNMQQAGRCNVPCLDDEKPTCRERNFPTMARPYYNIEEMAVI